MRNPRRMNIGSLRPAVLLAVLAHLLADAPLVNAVWELPSFNLFSPPEPFEFSS